MFDDMPVKMQAGITIVAFSITRFQRLAWQPGSCQSNSEFACPSTKRKGVQGLTCNIFNIQLSIFMKPYDAGRSTACQQRLSGTWFGFRFCSGIKSY